ncbi:hypothetical protein F4802DRAFT_105141 [Xylaria palmicola]|nr:hypothetical protein F4802DRAFT_105141 [Xylaria palmicola]
MSGYRKPLAILFFTHADRTKILEYLPASTVSFTPLGTPFRGTKMQNLAKIVARLMVHIGFHNGIVHKFSELRDRLHIPTACFIELYNSDYRKKIGLPGLAQGRVRPFRDKLLDSTLLNIAQVVEEESERSLIVVVLCMSSHYL